MTALIKALNTMKKEQAEIRNLIGKKGEVDEDDLPKLPYLKAVINETQIVSSSSSACAKGNNRKMRPQGLSDSTQNGDLCLLVGCCKRSRILE